MEEEFGLQRDYNDLPDVNKLVRRAAALPLLPLDKVEDYLLHTLEDAHTRQKGLYQTHRLCDRDLYRRQIFTTNLEPLPDRETQNQQPSRGLAQQT